MSWGYFWLTLLLLVGIFLMLVVLIQRGRGGGLAGAFGGLGGASAFGTKAGDVFTVITIVTAVLWVFLACIAGWQLRREAAPSSFFGNEGVVDSVQTAPGTMAPSDGTGDTSGDAGNESGTPVDDKDKSDGAASAKTPVEEDKLGQSEKKEE